MFQSTLPCGERLNPPVLCLALYSFNPRSRAGSDPVELITPCILAGFNPRSRAGSDHRRSGKPYTTKRFNPRSRAGSDPVTEDGWYYQQVSIHAPVRGATFNSRMSPFMKSFQSTLPCGERHAVDQVKLLLPGFQSTLPCGERPFRRGEYRCPQCFNPRSRAGSDPV